MSNENMSSMRLFCSPGASSDHRAQLRRRCKLGLLLAITFTLVQVLGPSPVNCQDFQDLTNKQTSSPSNGNLQLPQFTFQQINRQQQPQPVAAFNNNNSNGLPQTILAAPQQPPARQTTASRPLLSTRFGPQAPASAGSQMSAQASQSATTFASPQSAPLAATSQSLSSSSSSSPSPPSSQQANGIEQMMKNALARSARLEASGAEQRQDNTERLMPQSRSGQQQPADKVAEPSETTSDAQMAPDGGADDKATTTATTSGHETVYSDQRFANLFARRGGGKKARIAPTEQVKAKPTLPSFIKSPPDPKQFAATASFEQPANNGARQVTPAASATSFASARLQQQNQLDRSRANLASQQKKSAAISASAAAAAQNIANKRNNNTGNNSLNSNKPSPPLPKASASNKNAALATTSKPLVAANNPFNRAQSNSNDPANVIAMARKRLLANNALESGKLKLQQQQQQQQKATTLSSTN